jgi:hypothetical protein
MTVFGGIVILLGYSDIFSKSDTDVGHTNIVQHRIELLEDKTFKQRYRRILPSMYDEVKVYAWKCIAVFLRILVQHTIINTHSQTVVFLLY